MAWKATTPGGGPKAAIHSGLDSALGSHPCVALSSYQAPPLYGGCPSIAQQKSSTLEENCDKSWGVWGAKPLKELPPEMRPSAQIPPETAGDIKSRSPSLQLMLYVQVFASKGDVPHATYIHRRCATDIDWLEGLKTKAQGAEQPPEGPSCVRSRAPENIRHEAEEPARKQMPQ